MPLIIPGKFRQFVKEMANAQKPGSPVHAAIMSGVKASLQSRIKHQFADGIGPDDRRHKPKKSGKPALVSRRLGNAARARVAGNDVYVEPKTAHVGDILDTHQDGHTFPAREGRVYQYRDRKGRIVSYRKFVRRVRDSSASGRDYQNTQVTTYRKATGTKGDRTVASRFITDRVKFGPRRLVPRPIRPVGSLTRPWQKALADGVQAGAAKRIGRFTE